MGLELLLILAVSAAFTRGIFNHRENMEYARKGVDSPAAKRRAAAQAAKLAAAGGTATSTGGGATGGGAASSGGAAPAPGFKDYASTLWSDLWADAKLRHDRERAKKRPDGGRRLRDVLKDWYNWTKNPLGENDPANPRPGDVDPAPVPDPATAPDPQAGQTPPPDPNARNCPECGGQLIEHPDGWWHPGRQPCPVDGRTDPYAGPPPPPDPAATPTPAPDPSVVDMEPVLACSRCARGVIRNGKCDSCLEPDDRGQQQAPPEPPLEPIRCSECNDQINRAGGHMSTADGRCPKGADHTSTCTRCGGRLDEGGGHIDAAGCVSPLDDGQWPTAEDRERLERDAKHLFGKWCGDANCGCACARCKAAPKERGEFCESCWNENFDDEEHKRHYPDSPTCVHCGSVQVIRGRYLGEDVDQWICKKCHQPTPDEVAAQTPDGDQPADSNTTPVTPNAGGNTVALEFNYDAIVAAHREMIAALAARLEQAEQVKTHAQQAATAADGMDEGRSNLIAKAQALISGMEEAKFDATSLEGCTEAATAFSAEDAGAIEERTTELVAKADEVIAKTNSALESVTASLAHIEATYGSLAEGVQSTGVRGEALEAV